MDRDTEVPPPENREEVTNREEETNGEVFNGNQPVEDDATETSKENLVNPYERFGEDHAAEDGEWLKVDGEPERTSPVVLLPWRMALLLFVSTLAQNFSYQSTDLITDSTGYGSWTAAQLQQFSQLVYNMIYLGPVFGLVIDIVRVFGERYRFIMILAAIGNTILCFILFGKPSLPDHYGSTLVTAWLIQVFVMFMYIPATSMVIAYGNSYQETRSESSARIGGLMAQTMFVRSLSTFVSSFVTTFGVDRITSPNPQRYMLLLGGIFSIAVILLLVNPITMKRSYFLERRERTFVHTAPKRFVLSTVRAHQAAFSPSAAVTNTAFMFTLAFSFVYFMLPDVLYNDSWKIQDQYGANFSRNLTNTISCLAELGAALGALLYALWMYASQRYTRLGMSHVSTTPYVVVLAGCCAWGFGAFFYLFGVLGHSNKNFKWDVYIPFQNIVVQACLRFAFMPMLSLVSMHAPNGYTSTAFQLFSLASTGGGSVSDYVTASLESSMGTSIGSYELNMSTYWKTVLICIFFHFLALLPALTLPKCRSEDETKLTRFADENEPALSCTTDE